MSERIVINDLRPYALLYLVPCRTYILPRSPIRTSSASPRIVKQNNQYPATELYVEAVLQSTQSHRNLRLEQTKDTRCTPNGYLVSPLPEGDNTCRLTTRWRCELECALAGNFNSHVISWGLAVTISNLVVPRCPFRSLSSVLVLVSQAEFQP